MKPWVPAYIGLGSNLADPDQQVERALEALATIDATDFRIASSLYQSKPVGPIGQPDYVNAVAGVLTRLPVRSLLEALQTIERAQGRNRSREQRWGPRTLDLDILVFGAGCIDEPDLRVPHPRIAERNFVLLPLAEIAPDLEISGLGLVRTLAERSDLTSIRLL